MTHSAHHAARSAPTAFRWLLTGLVAVVALLGAGLVAATSARAAGPVDPNRSSLTRDPKGPVELGEDVTVFITARDAAGTPLPDVSVVFIADGGIVRGNGSGITDATGRAALDGRCAVPGNWTLSVRAGGDVTLGEVGVTCITPYPSDVYSRVAATPNPTVAGRAVAVTVTVRNHSGREMAGVPVTLTPDPLSGALITPQSRSVMTDGIGQARFSVIIPAIGRATIAVDAGGYALDDLQLTALKPGPAQGRFVAGSGQSTTAGTAFATPFAVAITDAVGQPVVGEPVRFEVSDRPATFVGDTQTPTVRTDANGIATAPGLVAGGEAGSITVTATPTSNPFQSRGFATIVAGPAAAVTVASGNGQTTAAGTGFPAPLTATVADRFGNPVAAAPVTFAVTAGSATFAGGGSTATVSTGTTGSATGPTLTAGPAAGPVTVAATTPGGSSAATFGVTVAAGPAAVVTVASGNGQTAAAGAAFTAPLAASVVDAFGNPVGGAPVSFTVTSGSATLAGGAATANAPTDATGTAIAPVLTSGTAPGPVTVSATTTGPAGGASFIATVVAGPAALVTAVSGAGQTVVAGNAFAAPLVASVADAFGNPVAGVPVTFALPPASGSTGAAIFAGGATTAVVATDAAGVATSPVVSGATAGPVTATATVPGVPVAATYALAVTAPGPARADLAVSLAVPASAARGATVTATVTVTNAGPSAATRVGTVFVAPRGWTVIGAGTGVVVGRQTVVFAAPSLAAGARVTYVVTLGTGSSRGPALSSAASLAGTPDPALRNNLAFATTVIR